MKAENMFKRAKRIVKRILGRPVDDRQMTMVEWLRQCGAVIGENVDLLNVLCNPKDATCLTIGNNVTLTGVQILTHDASLRKFIGNNCNKIGGVSIGDNVFIGVQSVILPGIRIGNNVVIGAGSIVTKDIPDNSLAAGNPCRVIGTCEEYIAKHLERMKDKSLVYWDVQRLAWTPEEREKFKEETAGEIVYMLDHDQPPRTINFQLKNQE